MPIEEQRGSTWPKQGWWLGDDPWAQLASVALYGGATGRCQSAVESAETAGSRWDVCHRRLVVDEKEARSARGFARKPIFGFGGSPERAPIATHYLKQPPSPTPMQRVRQQQRLPPPLHVSRTALRGGSPGCADSTFARPLAGITRITSPVRDSDHDVGQRLRYRRR